MVTIDFYCDDKYLVTCRFEHIPSPSASYTLGDTDYGVLSQERQKDNVMRYNLYEINAAIFECDGNYS